MTPAQNVLFADPAGDAPRRTYLPVLTAVLNRKGVLDVDTVKGCSAGMSAHPDGGCYEECYACRTAEQYGIDFSTSVSRRLTRGARGRVYCAVRDHRAAWYRIGVAGDPSLDWNNTVDVCEFLSSTKKTPVIVTKHWVRLSDDQISRFTKLGAVFNTSSSGLDSEAEITHRVGQLVRLRNLGLRSVCRVVTCHYGTSAWARNNKEKQDYLLSLKPVIDNPLRPSNNNRHVLRGDIIVTKRKDAVGGGKTVSLHNDQAYLGACPDCPDQCGVESAGAKAGAASAKSTAEQVELFAATAEWEYIQSVIGSGYEQDVADLALADGIAKRAARKNMQIHSAIILKINGGFSGFFTFQNNDVSREFCLLQSVIKPEFYTPALYRQMVEKVIEQNANGYPALITTDPRSKFETPALFESLGFQTYLKMSGFCYMVLGDLSAVRMKLLAHITMTNVWQSTKGDWLRLKSDWNDRIAAAGVRSGIDNPTFATREGCWQGEAGFANVVTRSKDKPEGRAHNGNASVLDPVACEVIARFFMPSGGGRIYNPFGGGVQFGYVSGACGFEYVASEIRQNQCDANNKLCSEFRSVKWIRSDSSTYDPIGMFDLVFTCPPYYRVEKYVDYQGYVRPEEINGLDTYEKFRDALFTGYKKALEHLKDDRFFVVMTGDSRDKNGAYHCHEAETELFFKDNGLSVYNKIVYLEAEFTRLAQAKKTLHLRKFPKREQKIIVAFKGSASRIKELFAPIGRL